MIEIKKELKEQDVVQDVLCDSCGKSCKTEYGFEYLKLSTHWGYFSNKDLVKYDAQICEQCVDEKLGFINFQKESSITGHKLK